MASLRLSQRLFPDVRIAVPNGPALFASLNALARDQIPFASAVTFKRLAERSVDLARGRLSKRFTLRNRGLPKGIAMDPRNGPRKKDWPDLKQSVVVEPRFGFLADHEDGGKRHAKGGRRLAIPTKIVHSRMRTTRGAIKKSVRPASLREAYVEKGILQATTRKLPRGLRLFYLLRPEVRLKPRLGLRSDVFEVVGNDYGPFFQKELDAALRSRRTGSKRYSSELGRWRYLRERYRGEGMVHR